MQHSSSDPPRQGPHQGPHQPPYQVPPGPPGAPRGLTTYNPVGLTLEAGRVRAMAALVIGAPLLLIVLFALALG